jgi:hypothetical protein
MYSARTRSHPYTVALGDLDDNNIFDITVANYGTSRIFILYEYGNGTFGNEILYSLFFDCHPYLIALKDLNQE